jgi:flagellar hook assembly protein FlgD
VESVDIDLLALRTVYLAPSVPNPFTCSTRIVYAIPGSGEAAVVRLSIHDPAGRLVRTLVDASRSPGVYDITWDGRNDSAESVAAGIYFYRLCVNGQEQTKRGVLVR